MRFIDLPPAAYERWKATPEVERVPFLLPLDRAQLPFKLDGEPLQTWLAETTNRRPS